MGSGKVAQGFIVHPPIHSSFFFIFLTPFPILSYPSLVHHPPVTAFNVQNPLPLPTHKSALFSSLIYPSFANVIPADTAAPAVEDFIFFCNQMRAKQEFFKHHFRDGERKCSGQTQISRSQWFGFELYLMPSWAVSSIQMSIGMQKKSPVWEAEKAHKARSGLEGLGGAAEPQGRDFSLSLAFPRSFPTSHQHKHRTSVGQTGLWGRSPQSSPGWESCAAGGSSPALAPKSLPPGGCLGSPGSFWDSPLTVSHGNAVPSGGVRDAQRPGAAAGGS